MSDSPRVLLSIDYEPWFALFRKYDHVSDPQIRRDLDGGFTRRALDPILEILNGVNASIYLVGEIAQWYPEIPRMILNAGHELGLHCQYHRPLTRPEELAEDIRASADWCRAYHVRGYRAPMVGISEAAYDLLREAGFYYSSSIYAPAGTLLEKRGVWELPVSTLHFAGKPGSYGAPRNFSFDLLRNGEFPYGSSFSIGLSARYVLKVLEKELARGVSPVIILHPYEIIRPDQWFSRTWRDLLAHPSLLPFMVNKEGFLKNVLRAFPVSSLGRYLDETAGAPSKG